MLRIILKEYEDQGWDSFKALAEKTIQWNLALIRPTQQHPEPVFIP